MRSFILLSLLFAYFILITSCEPAVEPHQVDVLVIGGGTGGTAAGLQAARAGVSTLIAEPTPWLGGMLTAAGVSATDGNHRLPSGIWGEFRKKLYDHYGGPDSVATGWVSNTQFEPHIGAAILSGLAAAEEKLKVWTNTNWNTVSRENGLWKVLLEKDGQEVMVSARVLIDGTDLGDVAAAAGAGFDLGMDSRAETGEAMAPVEGNDLIQDLTYVAILKDYGPGNKKLVPKPANYDPAIFDCSCRSRCEQEDIVDCQTMLNYGKLPNNKYMINWPNHGNDYYLHAIDMNREERQAAFEKAKVHTLAFVYYIQNELGFNQLGLADDEFPSDDQLALIPYHREGRRIKGLTKLTVNHILEPYEQKQKLYRTGIAVGDYPIDHHHDKYPEAPEIDFPPVPSFNVPAGALIADAADNLLVADKAISVTNIVNGSTRLQPVVLQIGQAAGQMAAMAVQQNTTAAKLDIRAVQKELLEEKVFLMPFLDVPPEDPHFAAIQKVGVSGILRGVGIPYKWANQTWYYPDTTLEAGSLAKGLKSYAPGVELMTGDPKALLTIGGTIALLDAFDKLNEPGKTRSVAFIDAARENWEPNWGLSDFDPKRLITKREAAVLIDRILDPFTAKKVDFSGNWGGK